jgi:YceI-like domain
VFGAHSLPVPLRPVLAAAFVGLLPTVGSAQVRWTVDAKTSLVWWQMSPHLNHLWATSCPEDRSWRPGENRSPGWHISPRLRLPETGFANVDDTVNVPLFPRDEVEAVCSEAVEGEVLLPDTVTWRGAHAEVSVLSNALISGEAMRDLLMHQILESSRFPRIRFTLDSIVGMRRKEDGYVGNVIGTLTVRDVAEPITASVKVFPDAGGMRVLAKWRVPSDTLKGWIPKLKTYSLGANTNLWHDFFMGADLVFVSEGIGAQ